MTDGLERGILEIKCPTQLVKVDVNHMKPLNLGQNAQFCYSSENKLHLKNTNARFRVKWE